MLATESFPLSPEGYEATLQWLQENGYPAQRVTEDKLTTDGYTTVNLVNHLRSKKQAA